MQEALLVPEIRPERFLDPSAGTGMFISTLKDVPEIHCFEKDRLTGRILSSLYPESKVNIEGFQSIQPYYNGYFDVVSSNIPFGNTRIYDRDFDRSDDPVRKSSLAAVHNYFFLKGMDTLREGGILAYITTSGVMDSPQNRPVRDWLVNHANLVSTIRLPDNLFTDAGTEVGSDLIVLQKNTRKSELTEKERNFIETRLICKYSINSLVYWVTYVHNVVYSFYRSMIYCYINSTQRCAGSIVIDIIPTNGADKRKFFPFAPYFPVTNVIKRYFYPYFPAIIGIKGYSFPYFPYLSGIMKIKTALYSLFSRLDWHKTVVFPCLGEIYEGIRSLSWEIPVT